MQRLKLNWSRMFIVVAIASLSVGVATALGGGSGSTGASGRTIEAFGTNDFEANQFILSTLHFTPNTITVRSGQKITLVDKDEVDEPHTITIIKKANLPKSVDEVFECETCGQALDVHFQDESGPPKSKVNVGATGLNTQGDSILTLPGGGETIRATITAKSGRTLYFVCAIHPWMQGKITVIG